MQKEMAFIVAKKIIKKEEGCRLQVYQCSANVWTIGYGHTSATTNKDTPSITQKQAEKLLIGDMRRFYVCVKQEVGTICNDNQIASLVSFAFNLGVGALRGSTLLKVIKANPNNFDSIKTEFLKWRNVNGKPSTAIEKRRGREFALYCE